MQVLCKTPEHGCPQPPHCLNCRTCAIAPQAFRASGRAPGQAGRSSPRAITFGARNFAGAAGDARHFTKQTSKESK